jgi:DNA-binding transcriptional ArsR family regulator
VVELNSEQLTHSHMGMYCAGMTRAPTTADVFNAVGDTTRRRILDTLAAGDAPVGELVGALGLTQPQASKHLRVLREVGLVEAHVTGRRRVYCLRPEALQPLGSWLDALTARVNARLDRLDDYLHELQTEEDH